MDGILLLFKLIDFRRDANVSLKSDDFKAVDIKLLERSKRVNERKHAKALKALVKFDMLLKLRSRR